jgi:hypothetical protein
MKIVACAAALACVLFTAATLAAQKQDRAADEKQIIACEHAVLDAFAKGDTAGFGNRLAPEAFGIDGDMGLVSAADWEKMSKEIKLKSWGMDQTKVHWIGGETAILTYQWSGKGTMSGEPVPSPTWASTVYVRRGGKWLPVFHQETPGTTPQPKAKK